MWAQIPRWLTHSTQVHLDGPRLSAETLLMVPRIIRRIGVAAAFIVGLAAYLLLGGFLSSFEFGQGGVPTYLLDHAGQFMLGPGLLLCLVAVAAWAVTRWLRRKRASG